MKRLFITGGTSDIAVEFIRQLDPAEYAVDFTFHSRKETAESLVIDDTCAALNAFQMDLRDLQGLESFLDARENKYYGFVHFPCQTYDMQSSLVNSEKCQEVLNVNFLSYVIIAKYLVRAMVSAREGRMLAISSVASEFGVRGNSIYAASKAALNSFVKVQVAEFAKRGITFNVVSPGFVGTSLIEKYDQQSLTKMIPSGQVAEPADICGAINFLLSSDSKQLNGVNLKIDSGMTSVMAFG